MAFADQLAPVREREVQANDEVSVARRVRRAAGPVAALDEAREGHHGELALGVRLVEARPEGRARRRVLADGERVEELHAGGVRERTEERGSAAIGVVVRALEQRRIAVEEIALPVDQVVLPAGNTTSV